MKLSVMNEMAAIRILTAEIKKEKIYHFNIKKRTKLRFIELNKDYNNITEVTSIDSKKQSIINLHNSIV